MIELFEVGNILSSFQENVPLDNATIKLFMVGTTLFILITRKCSLYLSNWLLKNELRTTIVLFQVGNTKFAPSCNPGDVLATFSIFTISKKIDLKLKLRGKKIPFKV